MRLGGARLTSDILVDESTQLSKQSIRLQSSQALMAQAFSLNENILQIISARTLKIPLSLAEIKTED